MEYNFRTTGIYLGIVVLILSCSNQEERQTPLFEKVLSDYSGISFRNDLVFDKDFNIFTYRNFYNGGGVALGDINNDGMLDIYVSANMGPNQLYLNQGDFKFKNVTEEAGVAGQRAWSTGVSMADVNGDGWLDIYVCNSGDISGDNKQNELFINNGDGTFSERAEAYGLMDQGYSTHAVFFDYDNDGDLDVYLLNNSYQAIGSFNKMQNERANRDSLGGDKLYRNDGGYFHDVSEEAGILGSIIGFGLGCSVGDVNQDGWMDIFISNDFFEKDYLYINNQNGTFTESLEAYMRSISATSMGSDIADINNDGLLDIFVTDMLPEPLERLKQITTFEDWDKFQFNKTHGYHYQYSRNMLHMNNGDGSFSEMGRLSNVEATDWSWGALIFDMDSDGLKDLFVANGIYQDITDLDYLNFIGNEETMKKIVSGQTIDYRALVDPIPVNPVANYAYRNEGNLKFSDLAREWGLGDPIHSNGAAYGDLDNDGHLDLVVNNVNGELSVFKNNGNILFPYHHSLRIKLNGKNGNTAAIGAQVRIKVGENWIFQEQMPNRGFQSSVDPIMTIGMGKYSKADTVWVRWPDGKYSLIEDVESDKLITLEWNEGQELPENLSYFPKKKSPIFNKEEQTNANEMFHTENEVIDFNRDRLTYHMNSREGPGVALADINGDGLEDLFLGGAKGYPGKIFLQVQSGQFELKAQVDLEKDKFSEDTDAVFFDANGDGHLDLLVASGGNGSGFGALELADRLYFNDGKGNFNRQRQNDLGAVKSSSSVVKIADINQNGFPDIFIGTLMEPYRYGIPTSSYIYMNDGKGNFVESSLEIAPELKNIGMVTDAAWLDYDGDGDQDLILVGEWMSPTLLENQEGKLKLKPLNNAAQYKGWYKTIEVADLNGNGLPDLVLGNHGLNSRFKASSERPVKLFVSDFDENGSLDHIFTQKNGENHDVFILKHELEKQLPYMKKRYLKYSSYNNQFLEDIFTPAQIETSLSLEANFFSSLTLINLGGGEFDWNPLPMEAQKSWTYAILIDDFNRDGHLDLLLAGNLSGVKPEAGKYDASHGELLLGDGLGGFEFIPNRHHGLKLSGDIRSLKTIKGPSGKKLIVVKNNEPVECWNY